MPVDILKDDLYSEYKQEWYSDSDPKMGFGLSDLQIGKLERKHDLWRRLHPRLFAPENRCEICRKRRKVFQCPDVRFVYLVKKGLKEYKVLAKAERNELNYTSSYWFCAEWVKYV